MITKKHYRAIADMIKKQTATDKLFVYKFNLINALCIHFTEDNPNFDIDKFKEGCGIKSQT